MVAASSSSKLPGFYNLEVSQRLEALRESAGLSATALEALQGSAGLTPEQASHMIENVVGVFGVPLGVAVNFQVNGRDVLVPMVIEEPSVVAGASFMAKLAREGGGFTCTTTAPEMIAQIQVLEVPDMELARRRIEQARDEILRMADATDPVISGLGGGARDLEIRVLEDTPIGPMMILHLIFDTRDAMGANTLNTAVESLSPEIERLSGGRTHLRILSNLADRRLAKASCRIPAEVLAFDGFSHERVRDGIIEAWAFAEADPYRAATHNKGIMNGIDAVVIATGNDWRAVEAGAHAYAARSGRYTSLSRWWVGESGELAGELELPMAVGVVGGATRVHPVAKACLALLGVGSSRELAEVIAAVGLAQNLAALRALSTEGIQRGHMGLHARQLAIAAGAEGDLVEVVAQRLVAEGVVRLDRAREVFRQLAADQHG